MTRAPSNTTWSEAEDAALRELVEVKRMSAGVAAMNLNNLFPMREHSRNDFTRNSVIGRCHRLQLNGRVHPDHMPSGSKGQGKRKPYKRDNRTAQSFSGRDPTGTRPRHVLEHPSRRSYQTATPAPREIVDKTCQFIFGDVREDFKKCGHPVSSGTNWCEHHRQLCYQPIVHKSNPAPMPGNMRRW